MRPPTYLRAVLTAACPLRCGYCHLEGDSRRPAGTELSTGEWIGLLRAGLSAGIRKVKLLGGEPFRRPDLAEIVAGVRGADSAVDLSLITSGVAGPDRLDEAFAAGLSRANLSIQGFLPEAFARRGGSAGMHRLRGAFLERLLRHGRPVKLNCVYGGPADLEDLGALLSWAAGHPLVVNVLDDLSRPELGPAAVEAAVCSLRGPPARVVHDDDPHSLPTRHLLWPDGLRVEIKDHHLGDLAPWGACRSCTVKAACREGIHAVRLSRGGLLRACMDRPEGAVPLRALLAEGGEAAVARAWRRAVAAFQRGPAPIRLGRPPASLRA